MTKIPKIIFQTSKKPMPQYVIDQIKDLSPDWEYRHYTDKDIIQYFINNPVVEFPNIINKFFSFKIGAHKADLFRYYFLYLQGGVYLDSDAMIYADLNDIAKDYEFFSVNSYIKGTIFQGFLGSLPRNKIIYEALKDAYEIDGERLIKEYHLLTANMYSIIYNNKYEFAYKLYNEVEGTEMAYTVDDRHRIVLIHYWKVQIIPQHMHVVETKPIHQVALQDNKVINIKDVKQEVELEIKSKKINEPAVTDVIESTEYETNILQAIQ